MKFIFLTWQEFQENREPIKLLSFVTKKFKFAMVTQEGIGKDQEYRKDSPDERK